MTLSILAWIRRLGGPGLIVLAGSAVLSVLRLPDLRLPSHVAPGGEQRIPADRPASMPTVTTLHDWTQRPSGRERPSRDIFSFKRAPAAQVPAAPPSERLFVQAPSSTATLVPMLFKLIGFAEDAGDGGAIVRTAIIAGQGQVFLVKEGDPVGAMYRVGTILPDAVELIGSTGGAPVRLTMK